MSGSPEINGYMPPEEKAKVYAEMDQRAKEALEAFQAKYPWIREGVQFRFTRQAPKPMGIYVKEVRDHDFTDDIFVVNESFYKSKDGTRIEMGADTRISITDERGQEAKPKISFVLTLDELDNLGVEEIK